MAWEEFSHSLGQSRKWPHLNGKSVLPSEADIVRLLPHVRFVPIPLQRSKIERRQT